MAGARIRVDVEIKGVKELMRKLNADYLLAGPWTEAMKSAADMAEAAWKGAAPSDSGGTRAGIKSKVQARPVPRYALVKSTATRSSRAYKRYPYPKRQEYDPRSRNRLKLTNALKGVMGRIQGVLDSAARKIEAKWRS
jgi:hypothetical protein